MKKIITIVTACVLCITLTIPAFAAYDYNFSTGDDTLTGFGKSTSSNYPFSPDPMAQNDRRNKDAADLPPPYGYGSGVIPTEPSSAYHDNIMDNARLAMTRALLSPRLSQRRSIFRTAA